MPHTPPTPQTQSCDDSVTRSMADSNLFHHSATSFFDTAFSVHGAPLFLLSLQFSSRAPVAHWDAFRCGSSNCTSWYQIQLVLITCYVRYRIALCDNRSIGQLRSLIPRDS